MLNWFKKKVEIDPAKVDYYTPPDNIDLEDPNSTALIEDIVKFNFKSLQSDPNFPKDLSGKVFFWRVKPEEKTNQQYLNFEWEVEDFDKVNFTDMKNQGYTEYNYT